MTEPKERPLLFSGPMVRALLAGTKTVTRRAAKFALLPHAAGRNLGFSGVSSYRNEHTGAVSLCSRRGDGVWEDLTEPLRCPFGQPGDRLWVRETWSTHADEVRWYEAKTPASASIYYLADGALWRDDDMRDGRGWCVPAGDPHVNHWRPSIFMPRWASRLTLEVVSVRVERLQEITEEDAKAEGIERISSVGPCRAFGWRDYSGGAGFFRPIESFRSLWTSINGPGSWEQNCWVWVVNFRRLP